MEPKYADESNTVSALFTIFFSTKVKRILLNKVNLKSNSTFISLKIIERSGYQFIKWFFK